jgi:hypothetical protein
MVVSFAPFASFALSLAVWFEVNVCSKQPEKVTQKPQKKPEKVLCALCVGF